MVSAVQPAAIGVVGLAVMGGNLARNLARHGYRVAVYDREPETTVRTFVKAYADGRFVPACSLRDFVEKLARPRKILLMIRAGTPVDEVLAALLPLLDRGDILIDGGNSHFEDTRRRCRDVEAAGCLYVGMGVSGGGEGALYGPSLMPGGSPAAWEQIRPVLEAICAHTEDGLPCCGWIGSDGAGHFVKMVHNGIEYGDMQLICEVYHMMRAYLGMSPDEMHDVFLRWNEGELSSYLIKITADILVRRDADGSPLLDHILDAAGQKGTGQWAVVTALQEGVPLTLIAEAVQARSVSAKKEARVDASRALCGPAAVFDGDREAFLEDLRQALFAAKLVSYAQGFALMRAASQTHDWALDYGKIALLWRGGCIIRSQFLEKIAEAYAAESALENLLLAPYFKRALHTAQDGWRKVCAAAMLAGIPVPALTAALGYFDGCRSAWLPANLLQAQRDYFGAHGYERTDAPRGMVFHTGWTDGGTTA